MICYAEIVKTDLEGNLVDIEVQVEYWIREGQPSSSISERIEDEIIIESICDDTGYDWIDEITDEQRSAIIKKCEADLKEYN